MLRKLMFGAALALGTIGLIAPGAQANKSLQPLHEGSAFTGTRAVSISGSAKFTGELGGIEATLDISMTLVGGSSTGTITDVIITNPKPFGLIGHCSITSYTASGLPWTVHIEETTGGVVRKQFSITNPQFTAILDNIFCPSPLSITGGTVFAQPDNYGSISNVALSGTVNTTAGAATMSGILGFFPANTYGIG